MQAANVSLLSATVMKPAISVLESEFERATGHKVTINYAPAGVIRTRIQSGEIADVAILQRPSLEALAQEGRIVARTIVTLGRSGVAVAVAAGRSWPDIGSVDALKRSLLAATAIAYHDPARGHATGIHFRGVLERLGIAREVNAKAKLLAGTVAEFVVDDTADVLISQPMEILATPGHELVGWLPEELQNRAAFTWAAGVFAHAKSFEAAESLIRFLASPKAQSVIRDKGMEGGE